MFWSMVLDAKARNRPKPSMAFTRRNPGVWSFCSSSMNFGMQLGCPVIPISSMARGSIRGSSDAKMAVSNLAAAHRFFDEFRQSFFRTDAWPQALGRSRSLGLHALQRSERLLHRRIAALGGRFLAQTHERRAHQRLQFRLAFDGQLIAQ